MSVALIDELARELARKLGESGNCVSRLVARRFAAGIGLRGVCALTERAIKTSAEAAAHRSARWSSRTKKDWLHVELK